MKKKNKKTGRGRHTGLYLVILVVGIFVASLGIQGYALSANCEKLEAEQSELEAKKAQLEAEKEEIEKKAEYMQTDEYIEDVAREKFGLAYDDEIIFKAADSD